MNEISNERDTMSTIKEFLKLESSGGILLVIAMVLALLFANSPLDFLYQGFIDTPVEVKIGALEIAKPLLLWINDGLMALFFLLIGLEVKREVLEGELSNRSQISLPGFAAVGGMLVPALIFWYFNQGDPATLRGWAIPTATDIAFALGILSLLGNRVPPGLKIFLLALAIMDDLGAIIIIAMFYTSDLSTISLILATTAVVALALMNYRGVRSKAAYVLVGVFLWTCVLKSGVHATLAGVALAFAIPLRFNDGSEGLLHDMEHRLHPWVAYAILPIFAFANAGVPLMGMSMADLTSGLTLGISGGLFVGKLIGVFGFAALAILIGAASMPDRVTWSQLFGVALLCGIGLTMSLFISSLAFEVSELEIVSRLGVLMGSLLSAIAGYLVLYFCLPKTDQTN